jgi:curli biogenesis system outer membrane secretion channel CsgG
MAGPVSAGLRRRDVFDHAKGGERMSAVRYRSVDPGRFGELIRGILMAAVIVAAAAGCATSPSLGSGGTVATGGAGGATSAGANPQLERCTDSLGTLAVNEDVAAPWYYQLQQYKLGPTTPVLRMMIQQSNCFVVVERGAAMNNMMRERALSQTGEMRKGSNMGPGQMVAADYTMSPSITFSEKGTQGGGLGGFGLIGSVVGAAVSSFRANEASTTLLMVDNRSGVQLAAAEGSAKNYDLALLGGAFGGGFGGLGGGYSNTPEGKVIVAAFMDSYNQLVRATRNYVAQTVKGGLGTGGTLGVQGGSTGASKKLGK